MDTDSFRSTIDLHTHTYYSDGRASPAELVEQAASLHYDFQALGE